MLFVWGIVLAGGAGAFAGGLIVANADGGTKYEPQLLGQAVPLTPRLSPLAVFCAGLALGVLFCFGLWLIAMAVRRHTRLAAQRHAAATPPAPRPLPDARVTPTVAARDRAVAITAKGSVRGFADHNAGSVVRLEGERDRSRGTPRRIRASTGRATSAATLH